MKPTNSFLLALVTAFTLSACGGGGGGGDLTTDGGTTGGDSTNISIPANAITLDETNAKPVAQASIAYMDLGYSAFAVGAQELPPAHQIINSVKDMVFNHNRRNNSVATGLQDSGACFDGGTYSDTWTETDTSWTGTITFTNCNEGGVIIDGSLSYDESWNNSTYDYSGSANGTITVTFGSDTFTMTLDISETGNDVSGNYSTNISYSISGSSMGGWKVSTLQNIQGTDFDISSGVLLIEGANNTKVRLTVVATNEVKVELDTGSGYAEVPDSPLYL